MSARPWRRLAPNLVLALALALSGAAASGPALARSITHGFDDGFEYALVDRRDGHDHSTFSTSTTAWERVDRLLDDEKGPVFWFSLDGQAYLARDAATVAEARRIVQPMHELGKKQGKLGAQQGVLGAQQAELVRQQSSASKKAGEELRRVARRARDEGRAHRVD